MRYRAGRRGISRMELGLGIGLLAVIAAAVFLVARPSLAHADNSSENLATPLLAALSKWQADHPSECPTLGLLENEGYLPFRTPRDDAWGGSFRVACAPSELTLLSPGPDATLGTKDDLHLAVK